MKQLTKRQQMVDDSSTEMMLGRARARRSLEQERYILLDRAAKLDSELSRCHLRW